MAKIKLLIVDDSATVRTLIKKLLSKESSIEVVGSAENGKEAIKKITELRPDIVTMDIEMPFMDGFNTIKYIMKEDPVPILVIARSAFSKGEDFIFKAIELGALEILEKPDLSDWSKLDNFRKILIREIKKLAKSGSAPVSLVESDSEASEKKPVDVKSELDESCKAYVGVAASTGAPGILKKILATLPGNFPGCIFVVQHISSGFTKDFIRWLDAESELSVVEAQAGERIREHTVYVAQEDKHLTVNKLKRIELTEGPKNNGFRPSGNVLFESLGRVFGKKSIGVILSGMGQDGVDGLGVIKKSGGKVIAQDPEHCVLKTMPSRAVKAGVVDKIAHPDKIAAEIIKFAGGK